MTEEIGPVPPAPPPPADPKSAGQEGPGSVSAGRQSALRRWRRWGPLAGTAFLAFAIGTGVGSLAAEDYTETEEYLSAQAGFAERESALDQRESDLSEFEDDIAAIDQRSAELDQRSSDLDTRESELDARSTELDTREAAVTATETQFEAGTIPGDGVYLVGTDIQPGDYRGNTDGSGLCYWARLSGTSGDLDDVRANDLPQGPTVVTISSSDVAFETSDCGEWHLIP